MNTDSGCETETCGREVLNGMCILKTCDTENNAFVRLSDGSCYDCNSKEPFKVFSESGCDACMPSRRLVVASGSQLCMLESLCTKGINYPQHYGSICNSCNSKGAACDTGAFGQEYCEACGNHHMVKNFCVRNDACTKGSQFSAPDWSYQVCQSCTLSTKIEIGTHEVERQLCRACTTEKRF